MEMTALGMERRVFQIINICRMLRNKYPVIASRISCSDNGAGIPGSAHLLKRGFSFENCWNRLALKAISATMPCGVLESTKSVKSSEVTKIVLKNLSLYQKKIF